MAPVLGKMGDLMAAKKIGVKATVSGGEAEWTEARVLEVWKDLSENCKKVLIEIASTEDMAWEHLLKELGWPPNKIGGSLSSLGAQLRNHGFKGITYPLVWEDEGERYNLLPAWRELIKKQLKKA